MQRALVAALATTCFGVAGVLVPTGTAIATPFCSPANANTPPCAPPEGPPGTCDANGVCGQIWCPGSGMTPLPQWDTNICHTFYFDPNTPPTQPVMISGQPPGPPPPPPPPCILFINCLPGLTHP